MIKWFKKLNAIVKNYDSNRELDKKHVNSLCHTNLRRILHAEDVIIKNTSIHVDVHQRDEPNNIIVLGRYQGRDYINTFNVHSKDMAELVNFMRELQQRYLGRIKCVDAPLSFSAVIKTECDRDLGK